MPLHAPFDEIDLATLQRLVDDEVPEDRQLEYKRELNLITKEQKREFLADISAFANADGGHLIIGIEEGKGGKKGNVVGSTKTNELDQFLSKIQNLIRDGVEPNVHGLSIKPVETGSGEAAIVIFVRQSWSKPHWVSFRGHKIFYSRNSNGKYALDIEELRQLFTLSETAAERIRDFRAERIGAILEGTTPVVMESGPKLVLHVIPFSAGSTRRQFDLSVLPNFLTNSLSHNFEGLFEGTDKEYFHQIFRDGSFEFVYRLPPTPKSATEVYGERIDATISNYCLPSLLKQQDTLEMSEPQFYMLSLLDVSGYVFVLTPRFIMHANRRDLRPIVRSHLLIPEVTVEQHEPEVDGLMKHLRPAIDAAWQSPGWPKSPNYDEEGNWRGPKQ